MADPDAPILFAVYLGGDPAPGRLSEDHEVVLVVADDVPSARTAARAKWGGTTRPHVDGMRALQVVDGYRISLQPTDEPDSSAVDLTYEPADDSED